MQLVVEKLARRQDRVGAPAVQLATRLSKLDTA